MCDANLSQQLAGFDIAAFVEQQFDRTFVAGESGAVIAVFHRLVASFHQFLGIMGLGLQLLEDLEIHHVRERLDRDVKHAGKHSQLVEGRVADALLVAAQLGVVDLSPLGAGTFLDAPQRVSIAAP